MIEGRRLVFVGGLHRSGTTLLARLLAEHPEVSGFAGTGAIEDEGQHLQDVYPTGRVFGGPGSFAFAADARMGETVDAAEHRRRLSEQWGPHWDLTRRYLVEKSPPNLIRMRYLQSVFPGSWHVVVVRHPLVVAMATQKMRQGTYDRFLEHWFHAYDIAVEDAACVQRLLAVRYEALTADPQRSMRQIFEWLGLEPCSPTDRRIQSTNPTYLERWVRGQSDDARQRAEAEHLIRRHEPAMNRYGYSLRDTTMASGELGELFPSLKTRS